MPIDTQCSRFRVSLIFRWIALGLSLQWVGCASSSFNSHPSCKDCKKFLGTAAFTATEDPCDVEIPTVETEKEFKNLVFEGGGVKGTAYVGALQVMDKSGLLESVDRVAGTSAGAITALMVAIGLDTSEIRRLALDSLDFSKFKDGSCFLGNASRLVHRYGWYKGDFFLCVLECLVERQLGNRRATFKDLKNLVDNRKEGDPHFRELFVVGTDVSIGNSVVFSAGTHPDLALADAVRISMSIPYFFAARELEIDGQKDKFVDGGVLRNYPIGLFDSRLTSIRGLQALRARAANYDTLGFHLGTLSSRYRETNDLISFTGRVVSTLLDLQVISLCDGSREQDVKRSVFIDPLGIGTTDFNITRRQKCELINSGAEGTVKYFKEGPFAECPPELRDALLTLLPPRVSP